MKNINGKLLVAVLVAVFLVFNFFFVKSTTTGAKTATAATKTAAKKQQHKLQTILSATKNSYHFYC